MIDVRNHQATGILFVSFRNRITDPELGRACNEVRAATDSYGGKVHLTCSDVRSMSMPFTSAQERTLHDAVLYQRSGGMSFCVHVVGPRTTRGLQLDRALASAALIGSQNVTVYSMSDAAKVLDAARSRLGLPTDTDLGDICLRDGEHSSSNGSNNRKETVELKKQALLVITLCLAALGASPKSSASAT